MFSILYALFETRSPYLHRGRKESTAYHPMLIGSEHLVTPHSPFGAHTHTALLQSEVSRADTGLTQPMSRAV